MAASTAGQATEVVFRVRPLDVIACSGLCKGFFRVLWLRVVGYSVKLPGPRFVGHQILTRYDLI